MKAAVFKTYGPPEVLKIEEIEKPVPKDDEVLVKVRATSVNPAEWYGMTGLFLARIGNGLLKPRDTRLGVDFSGIVEAVGKDVTQFKPGDEVYGARNGAFAEYVCVKSHVYPKPANITFEQAGSVGVAAMTALQGLRDHGGLQAGQTVIVNGASGGVGTFAVQIAKAIGAEVTAVCSSGNVELIRSLGADHVIDYIKDDFTRNGKRYDIFLDIAGSRSWRECSRVLKPNSKFVIVGAPKGNKVIGPLAHIIKLRVSALGASQKLVFFVAKFNREDFLLLNDMFTRGQVKPVVEKSYPFEKTSEAMQHLGTGHAKGKIVVTMR
ncbi:MAG: NAD(P)-dependent alcohol dehydrogenase [Anaerolineales bacterium]|nr:MAG: NAD(P)-dependent alcohol dehydrogenase [Anaerolineales bacterium]